MSSQVVEDNQARFVGVVDLDVEKQSLLARSMNHLLSNAVVQETFAQIVDGTPTESVFMAYRGPRARRPPSYPMPKTTSAHAKAVLLAKVASFTVHELSVPVEVCDDLTSCNHS